jgi:hypothetical protein
VYVNDRNMADRMYHQLTPLPIKNTNKLH